MGATRIVLTTAVLALAAGAVVTASAAGPPFPARDFEVVTRAKGVTVYRHRRASLIYIGAYGRIAAPPQRVLAALLDFKRQVGNLARVSEAKVLARGNHSVVVYQRLNLPVISDRDFTVLTKWGTDAHGRAWITYREQNGVGPPPRPSVVRVPYHRGAWHLVPIDDGRATMARYVVQIDLAGALPRFLARMGAGRELPALFASVCRLARVDARTQCP